MIHDEPSTCAGDWHERPLLHFTAVEKKVVENGGWLTVLVIVACWSIIVLTGITLYFKITGAHV
jgi:hypothetical protein